MKAKVIRRGFYGADGEIPVGTIVEVKSVNSAKLEEYEDPKDDAKEEAQNAPKEDAKPTAAKKTATNPAGGQGSSS